MLLQEIRHLDRILLLPIETHCQCLYATQRKKRIERS
jgi:hypothetical protein